MENLDQSNNKNVSLSLIAEYGGSDSESDDTETRSNENICDDSDAAELSEMVLKNNIINACAHGPLSRPNPGEERECTRHMIIDSSESGVVEYEVTEYRDVDSDSISSPSDSSDSDVESVKDMEEISSGDENESSKPEKAEPLRVLGEMVLDDLPPIEDLAISLPVQETTKIGTIASIVDRLVIVRAFPETPAVDLDSVLFIEDGAKTLGKVFDVFGPVTEPHYCVRFNSAQHVSARGVAAGMPVSIAPRTGHTNYVFLAGLMKMRGSDASWLNDIEPPPQHVDYSDDEEERRAKKEHRQKHQDEESQGETSTVKNPRKVLEGRRNQRPSESSSRFGSGPARNRRNNPNNAFPRPARPWPAPPHPSDPGGPYSAPPLFPPPFNPSTPPPFMGGVFPFGNPRLLPAPPFRSVPVFGAAFCPQWANNAPPPPPGT